MVDYSILTENLNIEKIILYGNSEHYSNDIDLLIVSDDFRDMFFFKRINKVIEYIETDNILDPICLTNIEYCKLLNYPNEFSRKIISKGETIYER